MLCCELNCQEELIPFVTVIGVYVHGQGGDHNCVYSFPDQYEYLAVGQTHTSQPIICTLPAEITKYRRGFAFFSQPIRSPARID